MHCRRRPGIRFACRGTLARSRRSARLSANVRLPTAVPMENLIPRSTKLWLAAHAVGISVWLCIASPLWRHGRVGGCYDAGDSFYELAYPIPLLVIGFTFALTGWLLAALRRTLPQRRARLVSWSLVIAAWLFAVGTALTLVRMENAPPCSP